ncbi:beta-propeller domain-containing protein [Sphingomonas sp.]|uniref:beta-propeller domain-containing protein n=1 Tax=Sphingomonas sp. TaxID=28214 RepID=UPI003CC66D09
MRVPTAALALLLILNGNATAARAGAGRGMRAFASDATLIAFLHRHSGNRRGSAVPAPPPPPAVAAPAPAVESAPATRSFGLSNVTVTGALAQPSITNTQEADVDEGGIVKVHGRHLVILRRGRLFTVAIGERTAHAVDRIDAFPPGTSGAGAWYDEMLVAGDRIIVVGYSYARGGTEINRFHIGDDGRLAYEDSYHLRSNDYYSSTNYASRLIGHRLIVYTPLGLDRDEPIARQLPALRRWTGATDGKFARIVPATRIFLPEPLRNDPTAMIDTLHTVTTCDLATAQLACTATGVLGSGSRSFYVSGNAVYVWLGNTSSDPAREARSMVYRLPLNGGRPGAVQAWGGPIDQFSFREDRQAHALDVVVRADANGDRMWRAQVTGGRTALLHLPLAQFGDGSATTPRTAYRALPLDTEQDWSFHNRFVGSYLIYAAGSFAAQTGKETVFAARVAGGPIARVAAPHGVDRIDLIGEDAVVIGNDARSRLGFSAIELTGDTPRLGDTSFLPAAREGENRSQAFFFRPDPDSADGASGTLGLPITTALGDNPAQRFLGNGSAVAFLRRDRRRLTSTGQLDAHAADARDDGCQASCVDWYGNARPIFLGGRIFALMGYELVEGRMQGGRIGEVARLDYAPGPERGGGK